MLTTIDLSNLQYLYRGSSNYQYSFTNNALSQSTVDHILHKFSTATILNVTAGTKRLNLQGGTNSTPSSTGLIYKTQLEANGWIVTIN
jgi:hypothetical protein